jgi:hypothetical protein
MTSEGMHAVLNHDMQINCFKYTEKTMNDFRMLNEKPTIKPDRIPPLFIIQFSIFNLPFPFSAENEGSSGRG